MEKVKSIKTVYNLYQFLDTLFDKDVSADELFASGYLRGFISLAAAEFGDEQQVISNELLQSITHKLNQAKNELTPQDSAIVKLFWLNIQKKIT